MTAVTVVITSYNQGPLIREAVESALSQIVRPERIIIVDDGSDGQASADVLSAILDDCRHGALDTGGIAVDFIDQVNAGSSVARNRGTAAAGTPLMVMLDGDGRLMPTFIERMLPLLTADGSMVVSSGWLRTLGVLDSMVQPTGGDTGAFVSHNCCPATCMIRRSARGRCGGHDESMRSGFEDWDLFLLMLERGLEPKDDAGKGAAHIGIAPESLVEYCTAPASLNVTSMTKRPDLMRFPIAKHRDLYAAYIADAILGVEATSMNRLAVWEPLMHGDTTASQASMTHPTYGNGGMVAAVRLQN